MGLIKAGIGALGGSLADQWKEFFYCEALDKSVLVTKGEKRIGNRSSNTKASDNIISNGSGIAVADGQCMIIVEQGKIVEVCAEPGEFTYDTSTEPSIFSGKLGTSILETFKTIGRRFTYGGDTGKDQRVYYFNTKEIIDNKFGTATPIPFRVVDSRIMFDMDVSLRCNGVYSYKIANPLLFYTNVCGNVEKEYLRDEIDNMLKTEFIAALGPALGKISELEIRPNQIVNHMPELSDAVNEVLTAKWAELRGLEVVTIAMNPPTMPEEDQVRLKDAQQKAQEAMMYRDPANAAGMMAGATADAMRAAAKNEGGAMNGFVGMGMAMNQGGNAAANMFAVAQQQQANQPQPPTPPAAPAQPAAPAADAWVCPKCGKTVNGKFCPECGEKKPAAADDGWTCPKCGAVNKGKFCSECGEKKPAGVPLYKCDKCGWEPEDPAHPPKFCPECGDPFTDDDIQ